MHLVTQAYSFFKADPVCRTQKTKQAKRRRMWEKSNIIVNSSYSPVPPTGEYTCPFFILSSMPKKFFRRGWRWGTLCITTKKKKTLVIIQNMGLSETSVHDLDEKADSCLIWLAWVSCKSVPHWTPKKDMLFYLSAQQCDLHTAQASTAETGTFNE